MPEKAIARVPPLSGLDAVHDTVAPETVPRHDGPGTVGAPVRSFPVCDSSAEYDLTCGYDVPVQLPVVAVSCTDQVPDR